MKMSHPFVDLDQSETVKTHCKNVKMLGQKPRNCYARQWNCEGRCAYGFFWTGHGLQGKVHHFFRGLPRVVGEGIVQKWRLQTQGKLRTADLCYRDKRSLERFDKYTLCLFFDVFLGFCACFWQRFFQKTFGPKMGVKNGLKNMVKIGLFTL